MGGGKVLMIAWVGLVFFVSAAAFDTLADAFVVVEEPWQDRILGSNVSYAIALFFLLFLILGHGLLSGVTSSTIHHPISRVYKSLVMPSLVAAAVISQFPVVYGTGVVDLRAGEIALLLIWFALIADPTNHIGRATAESDWFRTKVLKSGQSKQTGMFVGLEEKTGVVVFHGALLLLFLAGYLARA